MSGAWLAVLALPALAASPEGELGAAFQSLRDSISARAAAAVPPVPVARRVKASAPAQKEEERPRCPEGFTQLSSSPDPDLYSYLGYRFVRSDGTTCDPAPSDRVLYLEPQSKRVELAPKGVGLPEREVLRLEAPEYRLRRNFYFRTLLDGRRRFFAADFRVDTGRKVPETVILEFPNRSEFPLLPWEPSELFELRYGLESGATASEVRTGYEYRASRSVERDADGRLSTRLSFEAVRKRKLTEPDADAVTLALGEVDALFTVSLGDRWARYYRGEKLGLRLTLWEDVPILSDRIAYRFDIELDPSARLFIQPESEQWNGERRQSIRRGRRYYAEWSFRRAGSRFTIGAWIEKGRTERFKF